MNAVSRFLSALSKVQYPDLTLPFSGVFILRPKSSNCGLASFNAHEGELDQKLVGADRLKNALLPILSGMGETLVTLARRFNKADELADTFLQFQLFKVQVSEVT